MTATELTALLPLVGVAGTSVVLMLAISIRRDRQWALIITILGLALSFVLLFVARPLVPCEVTPLLIIDGFALFFFGLLIAGSAVVAVLASGYLARRGIACEEFYLLLLFATLGCCVIAASTHFASLFLGLEIHSVSLYALIAYLRNTERSLDAGIKYLILAAVSSAFLLFGMALIYAHTGTMAFAELASRLFPTGAEPALMALAGLALLLVGISYKLALVPFHMWTADVYEGASAPVTAFVATASKGALVALLVRFAAITGAQTTTELYGFFALIAGASIIVGNLLALLQDNVKRMLAYSSIAHLGYVMIAFLAVGARGAEAVTFYMAAYFVTILGAFGVITVLSPVDRDLDRLDDYLGLGRARPLFAGLFTAMLLSLAGIPLTAGFVGKFLVLRAGVGAAQWTLALILVVGSVISVFYYLRVVVAMYMRSADDEASKPHTVPVSLMAGATLAALLVALVWLGVWPAPVMELVHGAVGALF
ncbi:MAG: NADH-quinone oxidoreductase subunit N [Deltaproteobacteria bacterium]|nr:NADH-quinone oxidoreductase subunit N [Deltaproteobacteria bacterium]